MNIAGMKSTTAANTASQLLGTRRISACRKHLVKKQRGRVVYLCQFGAYVRQSNAQCDRAMHNATEQLIDDHNIHQNHQGRAQPAEAAERTRGTNQ